MSYEDDIRAELSNSWIMRSRRKWLEAELARITASKQASPTSQETPPHARRAATQPSSDTIAIDGSPEFIAATEAALRALQGTPSWILATHLRGIKQISSADIGNDKVGGFVRDGVFFCGDSWWRADTKHYASGIAHEGAHAARPDVTGTEAERMAFRAQVQALRELGAPSRLIEHYEAEARNPTHHLGWTGARRAA